MFDGGKRRRHFPAHLLGGRIVGHQLRVQRLEFFQAAEECSRTRHPKRAARPPGSTQTGISGRGPPGSRTLRGPTPRESLPARAGQFRWLHCLRGLMLCSQTYLALSQLASGLRSPNLRPRVRLTSGRERFRLHRANTSPAKPTSRTPPMMAKTPKDPPEPLSPVLTAAAWLALAGFSIGLFQLDSAVGLAAERLGEPLAVAGTSRLAAAVADGAGVAVERSVACAVGAETAVGAAGAGAAGGRPEPPAARAPAPEPAPGPSSPAAPSKARVVGSGVGEPDGQCCVGRHNGPACDRPPQRPPAHPRKPAPRSESRAPAQSAGDGFGSWITFAAAQDRPAPSLVPGIFLQGGAAQQIPHCRFSGGSAIWSLRTLPLPTM